MAHCCDSLSASWVHVTEEEVVILLHILIRGSVNTLAFDFECVCMCACECVWGTTHCDVVIPTCLWMQQLWHLFKKWSSRCLIYDSALSVTLKAITSYEWILYARTVSVSTTFCQVLEQKQCFWKSIISYAFECLCGEALHIVCEFVCRGELVSVCISKNYWVCSSIVTVYEMFLQANERNRLGKLKCGLHTQPHISSLYRHRNAILSSVKRFDLISSNSAQNICKYRAMRIKNPPDRLLYANANIHRHAQIRQ